MKAESKGKRHDKDISPVQFQTGMKFLVKTHEINNEISKFKLVYNGPYVIQGVPHPNAYFLVHPNSLKPLGTRNVVDLIPYYEKQ